MKLFFHVINTFEMKNYLTWILGIPISLPPKASQESSQILTLNQTGQQTCS
ncbi:conserved hypothetical protein [Candidatus Nitrotoga fabula]|uniref:Uncharacterized protein n=1 Tax=Candidatus Nitrotoga fabula TaxID=2182327 RepID=A0A916BDG5_9PROT|nr:conserved hypothetical protein [Candidatus Nitrotoga fabula]